MGAEPNPMQQMIPVVATPANEMNLNRNDQPLTTLPGIEAVASMGPEAGKLASKRMQKKTEKADAKIDQALGNGVGAKPKAAGKAPKKATQAAKAKNGSKKK